MKLWLNCLYIKPSSRREEYLDSFFFLFLKMDFADSHMNCLSYRPFECICSDDTFGLDKTSHKTFEPCHKKKGSSDFPSNQSFIEHTLSTVNVLKFRTPKFLTKCNMQTVWTQIKLLLMEQSDQGLHCLPFH